MKDSLHKYFYKYLKGNDISPQPWNTPSDDVFDKAMNRIQELDKKNKKSKFSIWWVIGFLLVISLASLIYIHNLRGKIQKMEKEAQQINKILAEQKAIIKMNSVSSEDKKESVQQNSIIQNSSSNYDKQKNINTTNSAYNNNLKVQNEEIVVYSKKSSNQKPVYNSISQDNYHKANTYVKDGIISYIKEEDHSRKNEYDSSDFIDANSDQEQIASIEIIQTRQSHLISHRPYLLDAPKVKKNIAINLFRLNPWEIGLLAGPIFTSTIMRGKKDGSYSKIKTNKYVSSFAGGIYVKRRINKKFAFRTGLYYRLFKIWSSYRTIDNYNKSTEYMNNQGNMENNLFLPIPSPLGMIKSRIRISSPPSMNIEDGAMMSTSVEVIRNIQLLSIPLELEYLFPITESFKISSGVGICWNQPIKSKTYLEPIIMHQNVEMNLVDISSNSSKIPPFVDMQASLKSSWRLSNTIWFEGKLVYFQSLQNVFKQDEMSTKTRGFGLMTGISFNLN